MATLDHYTVLGCSHLTTDERTMTATEVRFKLAQLDESTRYVSLAMQSFLDAVTFYLVASKLPSIADGRMGRAIRRRKRHARYRRGREAVRPRHRGSR